MTLRSAEDARRHAETWCAYLYGQLDTPAAASLEEELLKDADACAELYRELNLDLCLAALGPEEEPSSRVRSRSARPMSRLAISVSVAVVVGGLGWIAGRGGPPSTPQRDQKCHLIEPEGRLAGAPSAFVWTTEGGATRYRFVLEDRSGGPVHQATVADTAYVLPGTVRDRMQGGGTWRWHVEPLDASGSVMDRSDQATFRIGG